MQILDDWNRKSLFFLCLQSHKAPHLWLPAPPGWPCRGGREEEEEEAAGFFRPGDAALPGGAAAAHRQPPGRDQTSASTAPSRPPGPPRLRVLQQPLQQSATRLRGALSHVPVFESPATFLTVFHNNALSVLAALPREVELPWRRAAVTTPLSGSDLQVGERGPESTDSEREREPEPMQVEDREERLEVSPREVMVLCFTVSVTGLLTRLLTPVFHCRSPEKCWRQKWWILQVKCRIDNYRHLNKNCWNSYSRSLKNITPKWIRFDKLVFFNLVNFVKNNLVRKMIFNKILQLFFLKSRSEHFLVYC